MANIHKDDIGTVFELTITDGVDVLDISAATTKNILFKPPTTATVTKTGVLVGDGTDGKLKYTTISGDLGEAGTWEIQAHIVTAAGNWKSDSKKFVVQTNL